MVLAVFAALAGLALGSLLTWLRRRWVHVTVEGWSMVPALGPGEGVLVRRTPAASIRTGEVVVVEEPVEGAWRTPPLAAGAAPTADRRWIVKRVVARPGDPVPAEVLAAVNGNDGSEPNGVAKPGGGVTLVPPGHFVLLGDNHHNSLDSRIFGFVPESRILGSVRRSGRPT